ncbi:AAA ATPase midasin [Dimargaris cristalligena]|nr:AAA ATPase midasin [Dimargaris cristalligena]
MHAQTIQPFDLDYRPSFERIAGLDPALGHHADAFVRVIRQLHQSSTSAPGKDYPLLLSQALDALSGLLLCPSYTVEVARHFRPILLDLVARWCIPSTFASLFLTLLPTTSQARVSKSPWRPVEVAAVALSTLLPNYPQATTLAVQFFGQQPCLLTALSEEHSPEDQANIIVAAYRLLELDYALFAPLWAWGSLERYLTPSTTDSVKYYAALALATHLGMNEQDTRRLLDRHLSREKQLAYFLDPIQHNEQVTRERELIFEANCQWSLTSHTDSVDPGLPSPLKVQSTDLSPLIVDLCGILLPRCLASENCPSASEGIYRSLDQPPPAHRLVLTPTTRNNVYSVALATSLGQAVLLEGLTGSGKTSLIEDMAHVAGHPLTKIHLGDQADSKVLLGTYVTTAVPGHFRWQPGVLTNAVRQGGWVLIEDIDLAPLEVVSALLPLLEERSLFIPSRGERLTAHHQFQLFATRSVTRAVDGRLVTRGSGHDQVLQNLWTTVAVQPLSTGELTAVIQHRFSTLAVLAPHLVEVFERVAALYADPAALSSTTRRRVLSSRDLLKWCRRLHTYYQRALAGSHSAAVASTTLNEVERIVVLQEALDCFGEMLADLDDRQRIAFLLGQCFNMSDVQMELHRSSYKPTLAINTAAAEFTVGRAQLAIRRHPQGSTTPAHFRRFAYTCQSLRMLERIAVATTLNEPVLLVGETGAGKTTVVQHLADALHRPMHVINLSQQSDSSDLLGGFKPVDARVLALPLKERFEQLFEATFSVKKNQAYLDKVREYYLKKQWKKLILTFQAAVKMAEQRFSRRRGGSLPTTPATPSAEPTPKKSKFFPLADPEAAWAEFDRQVETLRVQVSQIDRQLVFSFVEGSLVRAIQQGHWVLLDEINLASSETLESLSDLLQSPTGSVLLTERGDQTPIKRHPDFRVFACMNPATDVGKRDLPPGLRSRFTELYAHPPDVRMDDLIMIIKQYLAPFARADTRINQEVADFYLAAKELAVNHTIVDGAQQRPHYSVRTLTRALRFVAQAMPQYPLRRSLYDGLSMTFVTQLTGTSQTHLKKLLERYILSGVTESKAAYVTRSAPASADLVASHVQFDSFWIPRGDQEIRDDENAHFIITPSVRRNLGNLARVTMCGHYPVLIQGPTSSGKTSMIEYLARATGHRFVRVNNHEHTDIQEYLGTYVSQNGKLVFQEGILVQALRHGYWIVLDELNLAPSDVLEALNRLLDDNRELRIPETQEIVRPHPRFMLFATQNPAGLYGGRKMLSRAFRNRFIELHFDDIPEDELETILASRCQIAPSYCLRMVQVYRRLTAQRQSTRIFESKHGFITLRDMFRWAQRGAVGYQELAEHGYMILAERVRQPADRQLVKACLEEVMRVRINEADLYNTEGLAEFLAYRSLVRDGRCPDIAWTGAMRRLFTLVAHCVRHREPVLLVGDTGTGKTTVCQVLAAVLHNQLHIVNCHQNTETADILGGQRPARQRAQLTIQMRDILLALLPHMQSLEAPDSPSSPDIARLDLAPETEADTESLAPLLAQFDKVSQTPAWATLCQAQATVCQLVTELQQAREQARDLFEWHDGPLVQAMKQGDLFLLDEISLADDSVLERLNSVLEPQCLLVLAEKGAAEMEHLTGADGFRFLATMNPGGDYGKRELSPALRNRFTEIWVPAVTDASDLVQIIQERNRTPDLVPLCNAILPFTDWFAARVPHAGTGPMFSLRDYLSWIDFMNATSTQLEPVPAFIYGAQLSILDGLGSHAAVGRFTSPAHLREFRQQCLAQLVELAHGASIDEAQSISRQFTSLNPTDIHVTDQVFAVGSFTVPRGPLPLPRSSPFAFQAPTTFANLTRVLCGLQIQKPLLLEGSPGVGKTSLVASLAAAAGHPLVRINLSEQTDLMDLFGSDLPVEGGASGEFSWCDAAFLKAMKDGSWVLLDEINLASQSVLEGLNSCLDHRGVVYIPELDREFPCSPGFKIFAAQNPIGQGGGRKGLPKSFVNRFTQIYIDQLTMEDLEIIFRHAFPDFDITWLMAMLNFNQKMQEETMVHRSFGQRGQPWEFNLRDVFRWMALLSAKGGPLPSGAPVDYMSVLYWHRMRTAADRERVSALFAQFFPSDHSAVSNRPTFSIEPEYLRIGRAVLPRTPTVATTQAGMSWASQLRLLHRDLPILEAVMLCIQHQWMPILVGESATGKTSLIRYLALLTGHRLLEFSMNSGVDSMELLGGFEQLDVNRHRAQILGRLDDLVKRLAVARLTIQTTEPTDGLLALYDQVRKLASAASDSADGSMPDLDTIFAAVRAQFIELPSGVADELSAELDQTVSHAQTLAQLAQGGVSGKFEWIDGVLIQALERGHWLLIDNANLCNPSILDRLNALLEPNGTLAVHERGLVDGEIRTVIPHPNFRIFMTCNPQYGELSRAMRNRGIEIALLTNAPDTDGDHGDQYWDILQATALWSPDQVTSPPAWITGLAQQTPERIFAFKEVEEGPQGPGLAETTDLPMELATTPASPEETPESEVARPPVSITIREAVQDARYFAEKWQRGLSLGLPKPLTVEPMDTTTQLADLYRMTTAALRGVSSAQYARLAQMVRLTGYIVYLAHCTTDASSSDLPRSTVGTLSADQRLRAAALALLDNISLAHLVEWKQYLEYMGSHLSTSTEASLHATRALVHCITVLLDSPILTALQQLQLTLASQLGWQPSLMVTASFNLQTDSSLSRVICNTSSSNDGSAAYLPLYEQVVDLVRLWCHVNYTSTLEQMTYQAAKGQNPKNLTIAQLAYWSNVGMLPSTSSLLSAPVKALYPLLEAMNKVVLGTARYVAQQVAQSDQLPELADLSSTTALRKVLGHLRSIMTHRQRLWDHSQTRQLDMSALATTTRDLVGHVAALGEYSLITNQPVWSLLATLVDQWSGLIGLSASDISARIWSQWHPTTLTLPALAEFRTRLDEVWAIMKQSEDYRAFVQDPLGVPARLGQDRKILLQASATLYALEADKKRDTTSFLSALDGTLSALSSRYPVIEAVDSNTMEMVDQSAKADAPAPVRLFLDHVNALMEQQIVHSALQLLQGTPPKTSILDDIRDFLRHSLSFIDRSPLELTGYQRLLWMLEAQSDGSNSTLTPIITEIMATASGRLWRYHSLSAASDTSLAPSDAQKGPTTLAIGTVSHTLFGLVGRLTHTPIQDLEGTQRQMAYCYNELGQYSQLPSSPLLSELFNLLLIQCQVVRFFSESGVNDHPVLKLLTQCVEYLQSPLTDSGSSVEKSAATLHIYLEESPLFVTCAGQVVPEDSRQSLQQSLDHTLAAVRSLTKLSVELPRTTSQYLGLAYFTLGRGLLGLLVPNTAVDPAMRYILEWLWLHCDRLQLQAQIEGSAALTRITTGGTATPDLAQHLKTLEHIQTKIKDYTASVVTRPESGLFPALFSDLRHLLDKVLDGAQLTKLWQQLQNRPSSSESLATGFEFVQDNLLHYMTRLKDKYPRYADFIQPVGQFVLFIQAGLAYQRYPEEGCSLINESAALHPVHRLTQSLLRFPFLGQLRSGDEWGVIAAPPTLLSIKQLLLGPKTSRRSADFNAYLRVIYMLLRWLIANQTVRRSNGGIPDGPWDALFAEMFYLWTAVERRRKVLERERQSLYRYKAEDFEADDPDTAMNREMEQLFPQYEDEFVSWKEDGDALEAPQNPGGSKPNSAANRPVSVELDTNLLGKVVDLHTRVFGLQRTNLSVSPTLATTAPPVDLGPVTQAYGTAAELSSRVGPLGSVQARALLPAHWATMAAYNPTLSNGDSSSSVTSVHNSLQVHEASYHYDFYNDANLFEIRAFKTLIDSIRTRLADVMAVWSDQPALEHLVVICDRLVKFPAASPIAKLLTGLELFLLKAQDWETYASREFSLRSHLDQVTRLIIHWRQLELNSWPHLLHTEAHRQRQSASKWWFHLYNLVILPVLPPAAPAWAEDVSDDEGEAEEGDQEEDEEVQSADIKQLLGTLVHFVKSANIGEFRTRLDLIRTFARHLGSRLSHDSEDVDSSAEFPSARPTGQRLAIREVWHILIHLVNYYEAYWPIVKEEHERLVKPIQKDMADFVKIATFKDVNILALQQSAKKTHHALHKCLRKYRLVLSTPVETFITQVDAQAKLDLTEKPLAEKTAGLLASSATEQDQTPMTKAARASRQRSLLLRKQRRRIQGSADAHMYHMVLEGLQVRLANGLVCTLPPVPELTSAFETLHEQVSAQLELSRFSDLSKPASTLQTMVASGKLYQDLVPDSLALAEFTHSAISRMIELRNSRPPEIPADSFPTKKELAEAKRTAHVQFYKRLRMIKQKTLTDYLKQLKHIGLKQRQRVDIHRRLQLDTLFSERPVQLVDHYIVPVARLANQPTVSVDLVRTLLHPLHSDLTGIWQRADQYYQRVLARLTILRQSVQQPHSPDLPHLYVERLMGSSESVTYQLGLERQSLAQFGERLVPLLQQSAQWLYLDQADDSSDQVVALPEQWPRFFNFVVRFIDELGQTLAQLQNVLIASRSQFPDSTLVLQPVQDLLHQARTHSAALGLYSPSLNLSAKWGVHFFTPAVHGAVSAARAWTADCRAALQALGSTSAAVHCFTEPILAALTTFDTQYVEHLGQCPAIAAPADFSPVFHSACELTGRFVDSLLVIFQQVRRVQAEFQPPSPEDPAGNYIYGLSEQALVKPLERLCALERALAPDQVQKLLVALNQTCRTAFLTETIPTVERHYLRALLLRARPFLFQYARLSQHVLLDFALHHGAVSKLALLLCNSFLNLMREGFCTPDPDDDGEGEDDDDDGAPADGTGIGEGKGNKNVSDEIENEDQVLGTENEEKDDSPPEPRDPKDDNNIEMENDFDGEMGDADYTDGDDNDDQDKDEEEPEFSDQIGDVDLNDPTAVDDKLWDGDDDEDPNDADQDQAEVGRDEQVPGEGESELVAKDEKEDSNNSADPNNKKDASDDSNQPPEEGKDQQSDSDGEEGDEGTDELGVTMDPSDLPAMDPEQGETMDLPDDMDVGGPDDEDDDDGGDKDGDGDDLDNQDPLGDEAGPEKRPADQPDADDADGMEDDNGALDPDRPLDAPEEDGEGANEDEEGATEEDAAMAQSTDQGDPEPDDNNATSDQSDGEDHQPEDPSAAPEPPIAIPEEGENAEAEAEAAEEPEAKDNSDVAPDPMQLDQPDNANDPNAYGTENQTTDTQKQERVQSHQQSDEAPDQVEQDADPSASIDREESRQGESSAFDGDNRTNAAREAQPENSATQPETEEGANTLEFDRDANPFRNLADAHESWSRHLNIVEREETEPEPEPEAEPAGGAPQDQDTMEVDPQQDFEYTREDEEHGHAALVDAPAPDSLDETEEVTRTVPDDGDVDMTDPAINEASLESQREKAKSEMQDQLNAEPLTPDTANAGAGTDGAVLRQGGRDEPTGRFPQQHGEQGQSSLAQGDDPESIDAEEVDPDQLRQELIQQTHQWQQSRLFDPATALALWQKYELLTHDLALALSEQLRLILEPTLATKLKGDYRTGKRLNMKKIIPYIASQYKKDKIWMRRTKPSKRQYQILISVDDSKSMAESRSVELAFETLALVSKALSQLESGDIAVSSFGQTMRVLHPFDQTFTMESGAQLMSDFTFQQTKTDVVALLQDSLELFGQARGQMGSSGDLWQLQLILSDGICENHERLSALVRTGMDQRVMMVFIVMDNKPDHQSILQLNNVQYTTGADGKLSLTMNRYLDSFPFTYYLVLRDIKALPLVLSDALRQYFSLVADS